MISGDPKLREQLRDLPTSYLLDLLADEEGDAFAIRGILQERGLDHDDMAAQVRRRQQSRLPRDYVLWHAARNFTVVCTVLVGAFNLVAYYRLLHGKSPFKGALIGLCVAVSLFGFFLGYKLSTHVYHGARHRLDCGFPLPVGSVDLQSGREHVRPRPLMLLCMVGNALVGLALVLFPLLLIQHLLD